MSLLDAYLNTPAVVEVVEPEPEPVALVPAPTPEPPQFVIARNVTKEVLAYVRELTDNGKRAFKVLMDIAFEEANLPKDTAGAAKTLLEYIMPKRAQRVITKGKMKVTGGIKLSPGEPSRVAHLTDAELDQILALAGAKDVTPPDGTQ